MVQLQSIRNVQGYAHRTGDGESTLSTGTVCGQTGAPGMESHKGRDRNGAGGVMCDGLLCT